MLFKRFKGQHLHIVILLLTLCLFSAADEDDVDDVESVPPVEDEAPGATDIALTPKDPSALDEATCSKKRFGCCESLYLGTDDVLTKCVTLHQSKMPANTADTGKLFKFVSCFVECMYKQKKFIGKGDVINMKMVRKDAEKRYADRPKERDYQIELFEHCRKAATKKFGLIRTNPAAKVLFKDTCRPYFMFVYLCESDYHKVKRCPYYRWEGKRKTPEEETCKQAKDKCYEIDGITPPEESSMF